MSLRHANHVYLICGVPASGKTWVCSQLIHKFHYIPHDDFSHKRLVHLACENVYERPILMDCPFAERSLRLELVQKGLKVTPLFIVETPEVISQRYFAREHKLPHQNVLTRATTIMEKVREWDATYGTSEAILNYLKKI